MSSGSRQSPTSRLSTAARAACGRISPATNGTPASEPRALAAGARVPICAPHASLEDRLLTLIDIARILLSVLWWILIVQAILSWLIAFNVINTQNDFVRSLWNGLGTLTEPIYRPIRRILPDFGALDVSPIVVLIAIAILDRVLAGLAANIASGGAVPL
ncbi:hypothetical protein COC42_07455 [Sphingomonas spermidinifaciens]|uniref:YggT family protein n=1 Tax=Sphingomonas spermidinifaciens TaxID=1141889 RepID=A0A2A4B8L1_9SPHN|nr:hypothetical protein COC42_07455 [Sphingomonas spermidinifaciens]